MGKIIINLSGVSPDVLIWVKESNTRPGNYYVERRPNRTGVKSDFFKLNPDFVAGLTAMCDEDAWMAIERYLGAAEE